MKNVKIDAGVNMIKRITEEFDISDKMMIYKNETYRNVFRANWIVNGVIIQPVWYNITRLEVIDHKAKPTTAIEEWHKTLKTIENKLQKLFPKDGEFKAPSVLDKLKTIIQIAKGERVDAISFQNRQIISVDPDDLIRRIEIVSDLTKVHHHHLIGLLHTYKKLLKEYNNSVEFISTSTKE